MAIVLRFCRSKKSERAIMRNRNREGQRGRGGNRHVESECIQ